MAQTALLIIDVQRGFLNEYTAHLPALVQPLLNDYRYTVATRFFNPEGSSYRRLMNWQRFSPGSGDTVLAFTPKPDTLILDKPGYTCVGPELLAYLHKNSARDVHIVGIDTDVCVLKCAADLFERDYTPFVLARYCASSGGPELHRAALEIIPRYIGRDQLIN